MSVVGTEKRESILRTCELVVEVYQRVTDLTVAVAAEKGQERGKKKKKKEKISWESWGCSSRA